MSGLINNGLSAPSTTNLGFPLNGTETMNMDMQVSAGGGPESLAPTTAQLFGAAAGTALTVASGNFTPSGTSAHLYTLAISTSTSVTLFAPVAPQRGRSYRFRITNTSTTTKLADMLSLSSTNSTIIGAWKFAGGTNNLSTIIGTTAGVVDLVTGYFDNSNLLCSTLANLS